MSGSLLARQKTEETLALKPGSTIPNKKTTQVSLKRHSEAQARDGGRGKGALSTPLAVGGEGPIAAAQTPSPLRHFPLKGARIVSRSGQRSGQQATLPGEAVARLTHPPQTPARSSQAPGAALTSGPL